MKKLIFSILSISLLSLVVLSSCKKEKEEPKADQNDQTGTTEADNAMDDVNDFISNKVGSGSTHRTAAYNLPCGVVRVDSVALGTSPQTYRYTLNYGNNTACGYKYKSGTVSFALTNGSNFGVAGAKYTITFNNYKVEVRATGSNITLNGSIYVTNVNGRFIWESVVYSQTITHKLRGTLTFTYDDGQTRIRSYFQSRVWASTGGWAGLSLTISGDTTIATKIISDTGKTYVGNYRFKTEMPTAFKWSNCGSTWAGPYVLKQGNAIMNLTVPSVSPTTIEVQAGYFWNFYNTSSTPNLINDCTSNAYKITTTIGTNTSTSYQLY